MTQVPTPGRIVLYTLTDQDVLQINRWRRDAASRRFAGNEVHEGELYPAMVVRTFGGPNVNLQVLLDGNDTFWATSRPEGDGAGAWHWPPRV